MERETIVLKKLEDTLALGKRIADGLKPGDVIGLTGPLGAGKTALTQAIAKGLGVTERLASPTFTVLMEYVSGRIPMCHFDVYRVHDPDELFEIGFEEYLGGDRWHRRRYTKTELPTASATAASFRIFRNACP